MREVLSEHEDTGVDAELMLGGPSEVLLRASEDAQLVGLGSHGRGRLATAVLGSVARYCV